MDLRVDSVLYNRRRRKVRRGMTWSYRNFVYVCIKPRRTEKKTVMTVIK